MSRSLTTLLDAILPGDRVFVPGSSGEPSALLQAWVEDPDRTRDLDIFTTAVPGINRFPVEALHPSARLTSLFCYGDQVAARRARQLRHLALSYAGFVGALGSGRFDFDVCVVQTAHPVAGKVSLGPAAEFSPLVASRARKILALVNSGTPWLEGAPRLDLDQTTAWAEVDSSLPVYETGSIDPASSQIATSIADWIEDGDALQVGLGKTPAALMDALHSRRGLRLHSGMFGDGVVGLVEAGALDPVFDHMASVFVGRRELYTWAGAQQILRTASCEETHDPSHLAGLHRLIAVNSAVEVDLWGQAALETAGGSFISGAGGAPDFARAAKVSTNGLSIVALPSTGARGAASRIVPALSAPAIATLPRHDVDLVVTEFGVADLRTASTFERAEALIAVAHPAFRDDLTQTWREIERRH